MPKANPSQPKAPRKRQEREERLQEQLLAQIARAASTCQQIEQEFGRHPAPELETLLKLQRVLLLKLSAQAKAKVDPDTLRLIAQLTKPALEEARLEEMRKRRQLAEQKYRDQLQEQQAARAGQDGNGAMRPQTVERIENELKLF